MATAALKGVDMVWRGWVDLGAIHLPAFTLREKCLRAYPALTQNEIAIELPEGSDAK